MIFRLLILAAALVIGLPAIADADAQQMQEEIDPRRAASVQAAAVPHFIRHTQWPAERFGDHENNRAPIILGILGRDPDGFDFYLERVVRGQTVQERRIEVVRLTHPLPPPGEEEVDPAELAEFRNALYGLHALVIARSERDRFRTVLEMVAGADVLTVSNIPGFAEQGGMLGLRIQRDRVAFDANLRAIEATNLTVGSHVLRLARIVVDRERAGPRS